MSLNLICLIQCAHVAVCWNSVHDKPCLSRFFKVTLPYLTMARLSDLTGKSTLTIWKLSSQWIIFGPLIKPSNWFDNMTMELGNRLVYLINTKIRTELKRTLTGCVVLDGMFVEFITEHRYNYTKDTWFRNRKKVLL